MPNFLLPIDGSANALRAVHHLIDKRSIYSAPLELHLLNVQLPVASGVVRSYISKEQLDSFYRDEGQAALSAAGKALDAAGISYHQHIGVGELAATILDFAKNLGSDLILMGTLGRGAVAGALLGSVARKVVHHSEIPVLLVK